MSEHLPLIAWSRQELMHARDKHQLALNAIDRESARRGDRDEMRHGFPIPIFDKPGMIGTGYAHFATAVEAYEAATARAHTPGEKEMAPYSVHPVYLGKDDPATNDPEPEAPEPYGRESDLRPGFYEDDVP